MGQEVTVARRRTILSAFERSLMREAHVLAERPDIIWQQLFNRLQWEDALPTETLTASLEQRCAEGVTPWLRMRAPIQGSSALLRTFSGHTDAVSDCVFSPDGALIITGAYGIRDHTIKVWDAQTGRVCHTLEGAHNSGFGLRISPDGKTIAATSDDYTLALWDIETGRRRITLGEHRAKVVDCAFHPNSTQLVSAGRDGTLSVWDATTGKPLLAFMASRTGLAACAFAPDERVIGFADYPGRAIWIWDAHTGEALAGLHPRDGALHFALTSDGTLLVATEGRDVGVWDLRTYERRFHLPGHSARVIACAVSADDAFIVSASEDNTLKVWDTNTGRLRWTLRGHLTFVRACAISPDGTYIVSASQDRTVKVWDVTTGQERATLWGHGGEVRACAISPDSKLIISASDDHIAITWSARTLGPSANVGHKGSVSACDISADGAFSISVGMDHAVKVWDIETGRERAALPSFTSKSHDLGFSFGCTISPDTAYILAQPHHALEIWEAQDTKWRQRWHTSDSVGNWAISEDGSTVAMMDLNGNLVLRTARTGKRLAVLRRRKVTARDFVVNVGKWSLISATADGQARNWRTPNQPGLVILDRQEERLRAYAISPDYTLVGAEGPNRTLTLLDAASGEERASLQGHTGEIISCVFSPDGRFIITGSTDGTARIWDVVSLEPHAVLAGHSGHVVAAWPTPDASHVVTASWDHTLRVWNIASGQQRAYLPLSGYAECLALHPWRPIALCGVNGGNLYQVDLMGIAYGPIIVTARLQGTNLGVCCPICRTNLALGQNQLGSDLTCVQRDCDCRMRINPFAT